MRENNGRFIENTNIAVSEAEKPMMLRARDRSPSMSRTRPYAGDVTSAGFPDWVACCSSERNSADWLRRSVSFILDVRENVAICSRIQSSRRSASYALRMRGSADSVAALTLDLLSARYRGMSEVIAGLATDKPPYSVGPQVRRDEIY